MSSSGGLNVKKIVLVRHASAVSNAPDDFSRSLRKKGHKETRAMAEWYRSFEDVPDLFLSSPANRAIETAQLFAKQLGYRKTRIVQDERLYGGIDPFDFLAILRRLDNKHESVMVFGHDPSFTDFAQFIARGFKNYLPKCSIFGVSTNRRSWATIRSGDGHLDIFEHPDGLHQRQELARTIRVELAGRIENGILSALGEFGLKGEAVEDQKRIRRASTKLAKTFATQAAFDKPPPAKKQRTRKQKTRKKST
jgi:phosphohistidine phosphatase